MVGDQKFNTMKNYIQKLVCILEVSLIFLLLSSCNTRSADLNVPPETIQTNVKIEQSYSIIATAIPNTNAYMTNSQGWKIEIRDQQLIFTSISSSTIKATKANINYAGALHQHGLKKYLESTHLDREYKEFQLNGLKGLKFEITAPKKESDIYLISELNDIIHITSLINSDDNADKIISTLRLSYLGNPTKDSKAEIATLNNEKSDLKISSGCTKKVYYCEDHSATISLNFKTNELSIDTISGHIKELNQIDKPIFESIIVEGENILLPDEKILVSSLSSTFKAKGSKLSQFRVAEGKAYLIRFIDLPYVDLIIKLRIEKIDKDTITITYQKLIESNLAQLTQKFNILEKNLFTQSKPITDGEVFLFKDDVFELRYAQRYYDSLNYFSWPLRYESPHLRIDSYMSGEIFPIEKGSLLEINKDDFPTPPEYFDEKKKSVELKKGKLYGIYEVHGESELKIAYSAVEILEIGENNEWVRLKFRNIHVDDFESNDQLADSGNEMYDELLTYNDPSFNPAQVRHDRAEDKITFSNADDELYFTGNPLSTERGFYNFGHKIDPKTLTEKDILDKSGKFTEKVAINAGDVIGVHLENKFIKTMLLIEIQTHTRGEHVSLKTKYYRVTDTEIDGQK